MTPSRPLAERLADGPVLCAGGYLFELERRGYLQAGSFVPETVLEHPEQVYQLHVDFLRAGSDVVEAFTYNGHREKLRVVGKADLLEPLNRQALDLARRAADDMADPLGERPLVCGNISNTNIYDPADPATARQVRAMYEEMVGWAAEAGVDFVLGETLYYLEEARIATAVIREAGLPAVITLGVFAEGGLRDGVAPDEAARVLENDGAAVVGLNCFRGPDTMLPHLERVRAAVEGPVAALPVPYRTTPNEPTFFNMHDHACSVHLPQGGQTFPTALDPFHANRYEVADFARRAHEMGAGFIGLCCGNNPAFMRQLAMALGRTPPAARFAPDMSKHFLFGSDPALARHNLDYGDRA